MYRDLYEAGYRIFRSENREPYFNKDTGEYLASREATFIVSLVNTKLKQIVNEEAPIPKSMDSISMDYVRRFGEVGLTLYWYCFNRNSSLSILFSNKVEKSILFQ